MNPNEQEPKPKNDTRSMLMVVVCAYVVYLGISLLVDLAKGTSDAPLWVAATFGTAFVLIGGWFIVRYVRMILQGRRDDDDDQNN